MRPLIARAACCAAMAGAAACSLLTSTDDLERTTASTASADAADVSVAAEASVVDAPEPTDASTADSHVDIVPTDAGASAYATAVLADNPVGYFRLEDKAGAACANAKGSTYPCALAGGVTHNVQGIGGGTAVHFDTKTSSLSIGGFLNDLSKTHTVELWVRSDLIEPGGALLSYMDYSPTRAGRWVFNDPDSKIRSEVWLNGTTLNSYNLAATAQVAITWYHLVLGYDAASNRDFFYVNGTLLEGGYQQGGDGGRPSVIAPFVVQGWTGAIDEIALYDYALPPARILAHYAAQ